MHKVSIIPRGRALGVTMYLPTEDKYSESKRGLESMLCSLFGGRIAEELVLGFDGVTTGASNDIERATNLAHRMVTKWGLSEKLGPLHYGETESGIPGIGTPHYSGATSKLIDEETRRIIDDCYGRAKRILEENRDILEAMKDALMEYETIDSEQVDDLMARRKVRPHGIGPTAILAVANLVQRQQKSATLVWSAAKPKRCKPSNLHLKPVIPAFYCQSVADAGPFSDSSCLKHPEFINPYQCREARVNLACGRRLLDLSSPKIMGILNTTPDSFSDGGALYEQGNLNSSIALKRPSRCWPKAPR